MNQPEDQLALRIVRHLDHGVDQLAPSTRDRLLAARRHALLRYREQPAAIGSLAWAGEAMGRFTDHRYSNARHLIAISALVLALVGFAYWQSVAPVNDLAELDTGLLTDELPINAYLDKGFDSWLKRSPR